MATKRLECTKSFSWKSISATLPPTDLTSSSDGGDLLEFLRGTNGTEVLNRQHVYYRIGFGKLLTEFWFGLLRWLKTVSSTKILMGRYSHSLSLAATIMVSKNCPTIGRSEIQQGTGASFKF